MTWLRARRTALISLLFAAIAVVGVFYWLDVLPVSEQQHRTVIDASATDDSAEIAGQRLDFDGARWDEFDAPEGTRALSIRLQSSGGAEATMCSEISLTEQHGERTWLNGSGLIDVPSDAGERYCQAESAPYGILVVFLVPTGTDGPFFLDVRESDTVARFDVEL